MALPKKGYKPGVYRVIGGNVNASTKVWSTALALSIPKEGYVPGIYKQKIVTIDANGDTSVDENDIGIGRAVNVVIDIAGKPAEVLGDGSVPQEGYMPGIYRTTSSTDIPQEGLNQEDFTTVIGSTNSGIWSD